MFKTNLKASSKMKKINIYLKLKYANTFLQNPV